MPRPRLIVCAGPDLFGSFFTAAQKRQLSRNFEWRRDGARTLSGVKNLANVQALITTWDSPSFSEDLLRLAPNLRIIAHCGGEVKARFARKLFKSVTISNAPIPMARATAEMGATLLLYCARNVDFYRNQLRRHSNRIYQDLHLHGSTESIIGREIAMIGFGRIGRALVDLLRGFDLRWLVYDPYVSRSVARRYPVRLVELPELLKQGQLLVLTAALTKETRGILNRARLARLPDGAAIINIARGGLIDLDALTREVQRGRLRCALDVTDPLEPLPTNHPLRRLPGAIVTPHVAAANRQVRHDIAEVVLNDLEGFFRGRGVRNRVTTTMLDRMT
jgi:phosphoglycerate dehydrogenase-like enzyme